MLFAHIVPGYFAASYADARLPRPHGLPRALIWSAALVGAVAPDLDVVYNKIANGYWDHSTLWSHSIWVWVAAFLVWLGLRWQHRWPFARLLVGLVLFGWLSHLVLDVISHGTMLFYPLSSLFVGWASPRVVLGDSEVYLTDPTFLLEPFLFSLAFAHWTLTRPFSPERKRLLLAAIVSLFVLFSAAFLALLPWLQSLAQ